MDKNNIYIPKECGELVTYDFRPRHILKHSRPNKSNNKNNKNKNSNKNIDELVIVQWNIERGYEYDGILETLRALNADIILLQEVDIGCERTDNRDIGAELAEALQLNYMFVVEFVEHYSDIRKERDQGGGVHGNAILSKFDFQDMRVIIHSHNPINWDKYGGKHYNEPRQGRRVTAVADIVTPVGTIACYSAHFETFAGLLDRVRVFAELMADVRNNSSGFYQYAIVAGDFNHLAHSIARCSPKYATDRMRFLSLGQSEAEWFNDNILSCYDNEYDENPFLDSLLYNLPRQVLIDARNPGFYDPFHITKDVTLVNYKGWFKGKLDWLLCKGNFEFLEWKLGNDDFSASDHKWLMTRVKLLSSKAKPIYKHKRSFYSRFIKPIVSFIVICILGTVIGLILSYIIP